MAILLIVPAMTLPQSFRLLEAREIFVFPDIYEYVLRYVLVQLTDSEVTIPPSLLPFRTLSSWSYPSSLLHFHVLHLSCTYPSVPPYLPRMQLSVMKETESVVRSAARKTDRSTLCAGANTPTSSKSTSTPN